MEVRFRKLAESAKMPTKAHPTDAGFDLYVSSVEMDNEYGVKVCHSNIAMEIPAGYVGLVFPRSSVYKSRLELTNCVGVIDRGYRGEVSAKFRPADRKVRKPWFGWLVRLLKGYTPIKSDNYWDADANYKVGERFAQIIIMPYPEIEWREVEQLNSSDRGTSGYGGSGR